MKIRGSKRHSCPSISWPISGIGLTQSVLCNRSYPNIFGAKSGLRTSFPQAIRIRVHSGPRGAKGSQGGLKTKGRQAFERWRNFITRVHANLVSQACISFLRRLKRERQLRKRWQFPIALYRHASRFFEVFQTKWQTSVFALFASPCHCSYGKTLVPDPLEWGTSKQHMKLQ